MEEIRFKEKEQIEKNGYFFKDRVTENIMEDNFPLHNHDHYEIYLFLEGDTQYKVEENIYTLEPNDMIMIRKHEMHRICHNSNTRYRRMNVKLMPEFFQKYHCEEYEAQFLHTMGGTGHKIAAEQVRTSGLYEAFLRFRKYSEEYTLDPQSPILIAVLIEILYLIHKTTLFSPADMTANPMRPVLLYLNNRYTENITLDMLQEQFFMSKYYLCRTFHKATGLTIHEYLRRKRLTRVRELKTEGKSIMEAALQAGFGDYSSFYRAYRKEYGCAPSEELNIWN